MQSFSLLFLLPLYSVIRRNDRKTWLGKISVEMKEKPKPGRMNVRANELVARDLTNDRDHNVTQFKWHFIESMAIISHFDNICMWFFKLFSRNNYHCWMHGAWAWAARPSAHIWALDIVVDIFNENAIEVKIAGEKKPHKLLQSLGEMRMGARKKN